MKKLKRISSIKESRDYGEMEDLQEEMLEAEMNLAERMYQIGEMEITKEMLTTINENDIPDVPLGEKRERI